MVSNRGMKTSKHKGFVAVGAFLLLGVGSTAWLSASASEAEPPPVPAGEGEPAATAPAGTLALQVQLADVVAGCRELLPPAALGIARFEAYVIAEPEVGAVVDSIAVLDDTIGVAAFRDCIVESATTAELVAEPSEPFASSFRFRFRAGPPADNAALFLAAHPWLVDQYPQLAAMRDRAVDAPRSDDDATAFASILVGDEAAMAAFAQWSAEEGIDLSGVRTGA